MVEASQAFETCHLVIVQRPAEKGWLDKRVL